MAHAEVRRQTGVAIPLSPLTDGQLRTLMSPLNTNRISKRRQGGSELSYLEAWDVKATLIRVFGFGGFSAECIDTDVFDIREVMPLATGTAKQKFSVSARCTVRLTIHQLGVVFTETAASSQVGSQGIGDVADFAIKTAESDALKRAAIYLGTQFGLSLYNKGSIQEVIRVIMAPGQEWHNNQRINVQVAQPVQGQIDPAAAANVLTEPVAQEQMSPPEDEPALGEGSQEQPPMQQQQQVQQQQTYDGPHGQPTGNGDPWDTSQQGQQPVTSQDQGQQDPTQIRHEGVTDAQHAENQALLARALGATPVENQQ